MCNWAFVFEDYILTLIMVTSVLIFIAFTFSIIFDMQKDNVS